MTTLYQYTAEHNSDGTASIIRKYGFRPYKPDNVKMNAQCLKELVAKFGDSALNDIATIHPDWKLITSNYQVPEVIDNKKEVIVPTHNNACGCNNFTYANGCSCGGNCGHRNRFSNFEGPNAPGQQNNNISQTHFLISRDTLLILGAIALMGAVFLKFNSVK